MLHEDLFALASKVASVPADDHEFDAIREAVTTLAAKVLSTPSLSDPRDPAGQQLAHIFRYLDRQITVLSERRARAIASGPNTLEADDDFLFDDDVDEMPSSGQRPQPVAAQPEAQAAPRVAAVLNWPNASAKERRAPRELPLPVAPRAQHGTSPMAAIEALSEEERIALFS